MLRNLPLLIPALSLFVLTLVAAPGPAEVPFGSRALPVAQAPPQTSSSQSEISLTISGDPGTPPRYAVPDFAALSSDPETIEAAKTIAQVLWDDLAFEQEFYLIPRDTYGSIPAARSALAIPYNRWRELGADGLVFGTVERRGDTFEVTVRLFNVRAQQSVFGREYSGGISNPRLFAHTTADDIHQQQRGLSGVARTRLTFSSDRDGEPLTGLVENRNVKEIYIADYDGANDRRVTVHRSLNVFPVWSADGRAIVYTSYRRGYPDLTISFIYDGIMKEPQRENGHNWLSAWAPDGSRVAFVSNRDGNPEIYVMDVDGRNTRRLTNHPSIDSTPTWSPSGNQIAFTSDRSGRPQIYVMNADGSSPRRLTFESYCDRPTWSPAPYNEIAYASRTGPGFDVKILDLATNEVRQVTFGEGTNESPSYAPNGRHLAFTSTRAGRNQVFLIGRDGRGVKQVTRAGNNFTPNWSQ